MSAQVSTPFEVALDLVVLTCCYSECGLSFAVPHAWEEARRRDHSGWYCPNGHRQHFSAQSPEDKLKAEKEALERRVASLRGDLNYEREQTTRLTRQRAALRGVATRLKNRARAGECAFCDQTFPDVAAHVAEAHPSVVDVEHHEED